MNRSKRLKTLGHLKGGRLLPEQVHLIDSSIFSFLLFDVFADRFLVSAYRRDVVSSCPKVLTCEVLLATRILSCDVNSAFSFDESNHLRNRILGWNGNQHVCMIRHEMTLQNLALSSSGQLSKRFTQIFSEIAVKLLLTIFWNPCYMIFAFPLRMA